MHPAQHRIKKGKRTNESILDSRENKGKERKECDLSYAPPPFITLVNDQRKYPGS